MMNLALSMFLTLISLHCKYLPIAVRADLRPILIQCCMMTIGLTTTPLERLKPELHWVLFTSDRNLERTTWQEKRCCKEVEDQEESASTGKFSPRKLH
jgi:hypothetical protein